MDAADGELGGRLDGRLGCRCGQLKLERNADGLRDCPDRLADKLRNQTRESKAIERARCRDAGMNARAVGDGPADDLIGPSCVWSDTDESANCHGGR